MAFPRLSAFVIALGCAGIGVTLAADPAVDAVVYDTAVLRTERSAADRERDLQRKPAEVLAFVGITPGMTVLDLFSGGGYYSEILGYVVGTEGRVYAHSNRAYINFVGDEFDARHAGGRLANVEVLMAENNELELEPGSLDAVLMALSFHDLWHVDVENGWPAIDSDKLLAELYRGLRPGGVVGIIDHYATPGSPRETGDSLHRIDPAIVVEEMQAAGFRLDAQSDMLRNPDDDHEKVVFAPEVRGKTDRFVMRFVKAD